MKRFFLTLVVLVAIGAAGIFLAPHVAPELVPYLTAFGDWHKAPSPPRIRKRPSPRLRPCPS